MKTIFSKFAEGLACTGTLRAPVSLYKQQRSEQALAVHSLHALDWCQMSLPPMQTF